MTSSPPRMLEHARRLASVAIVLSAAAATCGWAAASSGQTASSGASVPRWASDYAKNLMQPGVERALVFVSRNSQQAFASAGKPLPTIDERFPVGSVTKSFTATIVLQLVQQEQLKLNGTLGHYLPGVMRHGRGITIRELLQHRSGLRDQTDPTVAQMLAAAPTTMSRIEALRKVGTLPLLFLPDQQWRYSNTNYLALGLIVEKVTGRSYTQELSSRILKPLGLRATSLASGTLDRNLTWAAGALVSDARDVAHFYRALLSGRLLSRQMLARMEQTDPGGVGGGGFTTYSNSYVGDGLGIFATDATCGRFWGHSGTYAEGRNAQHGWITSASVRPSSGRAVVAAVQVRLSVITSGAQFWRQADARPLFCSAF